MKIVKESLEFKRGLSDREIRDNLFGWKLGQLIICPHTDIVYVFLGKVEGFTHNIRCFGLGYIRRKRTRKNPEGRVSFNQYPEKKFYTIYKMDKNLRSLTQEEIDLIKPSLTSEYINKLSDRLKVHIIL